MLTLTVVTYDDAPVAQPLSATFDEHGGTIGRSDGNQLVLPDAERTISRLHAQIASRNGDYTITNQGSDRVLVNGVAIGNGNAAVIRNGDRLCIGSYLIVAALSSGNDRPGPFADLFATHPPSSSSLPVLATPDAPTPSRARAKGVPTGPRPSPITPLNHGPSALPTDWNPFETSASTFGSHRSEGSSSAVAGLEITVPVGDQSNSIDALFDLDASTVAWDPAVQSAAGGVDALRPPGGAARHRGAARSDHVSELKTSWPKAPTKVDAKRSQAPAPATPVIGSTSGTSAATPAPRAAPDLPTADALAKAFAEGLGLAPSALHPLDEAQMRLIGSLLRESTQGVVSLLQSRAVFKRELRSDVTMIVSSHNNPLKLSPTVETAIGHLLGAQTPGFMSPVDAIRDTFDDLRTHQLGMVAGMRSALDALIRRFDPEKMEGELAKRSPLDALLIGRREARLWERFRRVYVQVNAESADNFDELFGKAFRRAYEGER